MNEKDVEVIEKETVYSGYFRIDRYRLRYSLHEGGMSGEAVREVFESGAFVLGRFLERFEHDVSEYVGVRHAIGVASGTDALLMPLLAYDVGPGDAVLPDQPHHGRYRCPDEY